MELNLPAKCGVQTTWSWVRIPFVHHVPENFHGIRHFTTGFDFTATHDVAFDHDFAAENGIATENDIAIEPHRSAPVYD